MESNIFEQILSTDNTVRKQAELSLEQARETNPQALLTTLVEAMRNPKQEVA